MPPSASRHKTDSIIDSLIRAKERLADQIQKINKDKSADEKTKQEKVKQLQSQIEEIEQQIHKHQLEKVLEDSKVDVVKSSKSSKAQSAEERKKEANIGLDKSILSSAVSKEHLTFLGGIRRRIINEDGGISERVKRTERMMGERTKEINKSMAEGQEAAIELAQSNREIEEKKKDEQHNEVKDVDRNAGNAVDLNKDIGKNEAEYVQEQQSIEIVWGNSPEKSNKKESSTIKTYAVSNNNVSKRGGLIHSYAKHPKVETSKSERKLKVEISL